MGIFKRGVDTFDSCASVIDKPGDPSILHFFRGRNPRLSFSYSSFSYTARSHRSSAICFFLFLVSPTENPPSPNRTPRRWLLCCAGYVIVTSTNFISSAHRQEHYSGRGTERLGSRNDDNANRISPSRLHYPSFPKLRSIAELYNTIG